MSRYLSELLAAPEPAFTQALREFEAATGNKGIDIRLASLLEQKVRSKYAQLGLDAEDSSPEELYHALQGLTKRHDLFLAKALGIKDHSDTRHVLQGINKAIKLLSLDHEVWVIRSSVMKKLLKSLPPRAVMKRLGYRSVESLLKRENVAEIIIAARLMESSSWHNRLLKAYRKLSSSDFEPRRVEILALDPGKWGDVLHDFIKRKGIHVAHTKELGALGILPINSKNQPEGMTIFACLLVLHYINELQGYSSLFKLRQVHGGFGELVSRTLAEEPSQAVTVLGRPVHWHALKRHFARQSTSKELAGVFRPHLQSSDLGWITAEDCLYKIEPALKFWEGLDTVGQLAAPLPISFNLMDNAISAVNSLDFGQQSVSYMRSNLWSEFLSFYLREKELEEHIIGQLESEMVADSELVFLDDKEFVV